MPRPDLLLVGQFDDTSLGAMLLIGALLLTALSALALSALLWFRNRAGKRSRPARKRAV